MLSKTSPAAINSTSYEHGRTLLFQAIWNQQESIALMLLQHPHIHVDTREAEFGFTALHASAYYGLIEIVKKNPGKGGKYWHSR